MTPNEQLERRAYQSLRLHSLASLTANSRRALRPPLNMVLGVMKRALLVFILYSSHALACSIPPDHLYENNEILVRSTPTIVLATPENYQDHPEFHVPVFTFTTNRVLKGTAPQTFELPGYIASNIEQYPKDHDGHLDPAFWAYDAATSIQPGDCIAYGIFQLGEQYLIFLRTESHRRAFEMVRSDQDLWYKAVMRLIQDQDNERTSDSETK